MITALTFNSLSSGQHTDLGYTLAVESLLVCVPPARVRACVCVCVCKALTPLCSIYWFCCFILMSCALAITAWLPSLNGWMGTERLTSDPAPSCSSAVASGFVCVHRSPLGLLRRRWRERWWGCWKAASPRDCFHTKTWETLLPRFQLHRSIIPPSAQLEWRLSYCFLSLLW